MLPFVDTHVHFFRLSAGEVEYAWLGPGETHPMIGDIEGLKAARFATEEFRAQSRFQNVTKAVHVGISTNDDPVVETRWLQSLADAGGIPQGIVARCDLASGDAARTLELHRESPNMRGVRDNGQPGSMADPAWRDGYRFLADDDLVFCHEVGVDRMAEAVALVEAIPEVTFCLEHCAMPRQLDDDGFRTWREAITAMAAVPTTVAKISAFGQWGRFWTLDLVRRWADAIVEAFGPSRVFFGSNFPVDGLFSSYPDLITAYRHLVSRYSEDEQRDMLGRNAERVFRI